LRRPRREGLVVGAASAVIVTRNPAARLRTWDRWSMRRTDVAALEQLGASNTSAGQKNNQRCTTGDRYKRPKHSGQPSEPLGLGRYDGCRPEEKEARSFKHVRKSEIVEWRGGRYGQSTTDNQADVYPCDERRHDTGRYGMGPHF
jgi:hypothetical protein